METFERLLVDLSDANIDFILVGGLAVALCGYVRATEDVDILVDPSTENLERLLDRLAAFGEGAARELDVTDFTMEEGNVCVVEEFSLDIYTVMSGHTYEDLRALTNEHQVDDRAVRSLSAEGLLRLMKNSLRPKDQLDVQALRQILRDREGE